MDLFRAIILPATDGETDGERERWRKKKGYEKRYRSRVRGGLWREREKRHRPRCARGALRRISSARCTFQGSCSRRACGCSGLGQFLIGREEKRAALSNSILPAFPEHQGYSGDFPGGPVVETLGSHCRGCRFDPWLGN